MKTVELRNLSILVPVSGDQCWNTPIPCTPEIDESLEMRNKGNMEDGFRVSK